MSTFEARLAELEAKARTLRARAEARGAIADAVVKQKLTELDASLQRARTRLQSAREKAADAWHEIEKDLLHAVQDARSAFERN